jgi:hypothetical protein
MKFLQFWSELSMWNKFGLSMVAAAILLAIAVFIF